MYEDGLLKIAVGDEPVYIYPSMANRHGLIAGATGTGKTVTLKTIVQSMSDAGIPTFVCDIKGDVTGIAVPGEGGEKLMARLANLGIDEYDFYGSPVRFWDVYGEGGNPVRTTITEMGPMLLARLLNLTDVQQGVLNIAFHVADDEGLLLLDLKDLRSMIAYIGDNAEQYQTRYGQIAKTSIGAIQRELLTLEDAGGDIFFGEPALQITDWLDFDSDGRGYVNVLNCVKLVQSPLLYSTFLLWMLSELYETLPEAGDLALPKICFFFDEAHLLFDDAPKALLDKVEQIVKLIRSKGVGVYFITQSPSDIPDDVLAQLGNRIQHALRAYTPSEQKAIKVAAQSFRENPAFDTEEAITELGTGEALISCLDEDGKPTIVQRAMVIAPHCSMNAADAADVDNIRAADTLKSKYAEAIDRESAYELLAEKAEASAAEAEQRAAEEAAAAEYAAQEREREKAEAAAQKQAECEQQAAFKEAQRRIAAQEKERQKAIAAQERERQKQMERMEREAAKMFEAGIKQAMKGSTSTRKKSTSTKRKTTSTKRSTTKRTTQYQPQPPMPGGFGGPGGPGPDQGRAPQPPQDPMQQMMGDFTGGLARGIMGALSKGFR